MLTPLPSELKLARKRAGLTQVQLSALSRVSQSVIAKIESGKVDPAYSTVTKLFSALENTASKVKTVGEVMHSGIVAVGPKDLVSTVSAKMKRFGISQLPVVSHAQVVGLISEDGVLSAVGRGLNPRVSVVKSVMSPSPPCISSSAPASSLQPILHHSPIVCVVDKNKLVGVVTRADLLTVF